MSLSRDVREKIAEVFNVQKSGVTEIKDNEVLRDGRTDEDLLAITLEKMNAYIGSEETFARAWEITISKINYELNPPPIEIKPPITIMAETEKEAVKKAEEIIEVIEKTNDTKKSK
jgi:hypothetical protein